MRFTRILSMLGLAIGLVAGCDDATAPDMETVAGTYAATTFVGMDGSNQIDVLADGGYIALTLAADGTTNGTFFVPEGNEDGSDYTADLTGTWSLSGSRVTLDHATDTLLRDVDFTYEDGRLVSSSVYAELVLTKQ